MATYRVGHAVQLDHRGATIRKKLEQRSAYRRGRRTRDLRYRAPRFLNRTRPDGWLAPTLQHPVATTMSWTARLARWAPVRPVHVERVVFDTHAISAGRPLNGAEHQHGVRAVVPTGKQAGTHTGRVAVRATGSFNITTARGTVQGVRHKHVRLLQRADGYACTTQPEGPTAAVR